MNWRLLGRRVLAVVVLLLVVLSFLPLWQTDRWWVRQWDYPRLQVAAVLAVLIPALLWARFDRSRSGFALLMAGAVAALAWQVSHFLAFLPPWPKQVAGTDRCPAARQLSLLNANVLLTNQDHGRLIALVRERKPDVLLLLEPGTAWAEAMAPLAADYPFHLNQPVPNTYGMMLWSRLPMAGEIRHLLQPAVPSMRAELTLRGGQKVRFHALHPEPPWPGDDSGERDAELVSVGRLVRDEGRAAVVMGDLNDVAWSRTTRLFGEVAGMGDPRIGRGFYPTFHAGIPLARWPLDHLFVSPHFEVMEIDVERDIGSDHFPIFFRLCLTDRAGTRKVAADAPAAVEAEASEEVAAGKQESREERRGQ